MREIRGRSLQRPALRRRASAWLAVASFLGLLLTQPFHGSASVTTGSDENTARVVAQGDLPAHHAAHDPGLCALCRAAGHTRFDLRAPAQGIAADGASLPLHLPVPVPPGSAPELRSSRPRAPPAPAFVLPS
jgi:hypothetical protein